MAINKVVYGQQTLIDLTQDTVTSASHILRGHTGHLADGSQVSGAADYSVTYSMSGGAYATSTPVRVISGEGFTSRIKVPNGYILQNITVTMGGVDISNSAVEYEEIVKDLITHTITYNLSNGISSNISPSEILDNEELFLKLSAPSGYNLSGVSVTMGGVDITSQVFEYDEDSGGGGGTPSQTQHSIYFEFSDSTDTTITGYWNDSFISDAITATTPTTYGQKTVMLAQLDGTTWYPSAETWETVYDGRKAAYADTPYNYFWLDSLSDVYPTVGSTWKVTIDGTSYTCTAYTLFISGVGNNVVCFGNPKYSGGTDDGSSIPANFYNAGWGAMVADTELPAVEHAIKIERLVTS